MLRHLLIRKKVFEAEADVDKFLADNEIDAAEMLIQTLIFDKKVFETAAEVKEWLDDHGFHSMKPLDETEDSFRARQYNPSQFDPDSFRTIEIRRGIKAVVGRFQSESMSDELTFSLKEAGEMELNEGLPFIIELCKIVDGYHPRYGNIKITSGDLVSMEKNFMDGVVGVDLAINRDHEKIEALGWIKEVFLSSDKDVLLGVVAWCPDGLTALADKKFRYFSPEFHFEYIHPHTGVNHGATLTGGALTNYPFLKMGAITELNHLEDTMPNSNQTIALSEHTSAVLDLSNKLNAANDENKKLAGEIATLKTSNTELSDKVAKLTEEKETLNRNAAYEKLFSEGKVTKAQLDALKEGKGMLEVLALSEKMNDGKGATNTNPASGVELSDDDRKVMKAFDLTEEEYIAANK